VDQNVIHVDCDVSFIDELAKDEIHHGLEGGWGICEAKEHDHQFEEATIRFEGRLPLVTIANAYIVVPPPNIQLREECRSVTMHSRESIH
jgi:hypothetical protein